VAAITAPKLREVALHTARNSQGPIHCPGVLESLALLKQITSLHLFWRISHVERETYFSSLSGLKSLKVGPHGEKTRRPRSPIGVFIPGRRGEGRTLDTMRDAWWKKEGGGRETRRDKLTLVTMVVHLTGAREGEVHRYSLPICGDCVSVSS